MAKANNPSYSCQLSSTWGLVGLTVMNEPAHLNSGEHFAEESDVLKWLADAAQIFRISNLPKEGKKLYMQMIDTAFKNFTETVVPWFFNTFSDSERFSWVVADQHWYTAWDSGNCDLRTDEAGGLTCDTPLETIRPVDSVDFDIVGPCWQGHFLSGTIQLRMMCGFISGFVRSSMLFPQISLRLTISRYV